MTPEEVRSALEARLAAAWGEPVEIRAFDPISMGASKELVSVEAVCAPGAAGERVEQLVLRRDPPAHQDPAAMAAEAAVLRAAARAGVPVPTVVDSGAPDDGLETAFVVMERLPGETLPPRLLRRDEYAEARSSLAFDLGAAIARVHAIDPAEVPELPEQDQIAMWWERYLDSGPASPAFEIAFRWLEEHRPEPWGPAVVHGDVRMGNIIVDLEGLTGVLDWELAHIGDPLQDLGWVVAKPWRFGSDLPAAGAGTREQLVDGYASVAGVRPSDEALRWWEVHSVLRWGVICRTQAARHLSGAEQSLELAMIGRRVAECEHDALLALGIVEPHALADPLADDAASPTRGDGRAQAATASAAGTGADAGAGHGADDRATASAIFSDPSADELLDAVIAGLPPGYGSRLIAGALNTARRELRVGRRLEEEVGAALAAVGFEDEEPLALAIRAGEVSGDDPDVLRAVQAGIDARLQVWNPKYAGQPG